MTVFDRPLRSDRLVRAWLLVILVALFVLLPRYVTWGAPFSLPLALQLAGALLQVALTAALLLMPLSHGRWAGWRSGGRVSWSSWWFSCRG